MTKMITWKCSECGNEDMYPTNDDVTLDYLQSEEITTNTMCAVCGAPCAAIKVEQIDNAE